MKKEHQAVATLKNAGLLLIPSRQEAQESSFGCDQEWYSGSWQRRAGCGPSTVATIFYYLARTRPELAPLYPLEGADQDSLVSYMDLIWQYVTPGPRGVNRAAMLTGGAKAYAGTAGISLASHTFPVPASKEKRRPLPDFIQFIKTALAEQSPIAFLNLSNVRMANLQSSHWVTLTGLYQAGPD